MPKRLEDLTSEDVLDDLTPKDLAFLDMVLAAGGLQRA